MAVSDTDPDTESKSRMSESPDTVPVQDISAQVK
jgi:hypothetical protein